jgi:hypothetical protein
MTQGLGTFWDYAIALQSKNSLLHGTTSHLLDDKLRHQLGAGMEVRLSKKVSAKKLNKTMDFRKWLNKVKHCDDALRMDREEYERITKENRDPSHHANNNSNKPSSRRVPNNNAAPPSLSSAPSAPRKQCLKLLDAERKLLNENDGCVKCRCFLVDHRMANCPNDFLNPAMYKSLTQADVNRAKHSCGKGIAAITTATMHAPSTSFATNESTPHPVAAILGMSHNPVTQVSLKGLQGTTLLIVWTPHW